MIGLVIETTFGIEMLKEVAPKWQQRDVFECAE
jgi:hypothetical protein